MNICVYIYTHVHLPSCIVVCVGAVANEYPNPTAVDGNAARAMQYKHAARVWILMGLDWARPMRKQSHLGSAPTKHSTTNANETRKTTPRVTPPLQAAWGREVQKRGRER